MASAMPVAYPAIAAPPASQALAGYCAAAPAVQEGGALPEVRDAQTGTGQGPTVLNGVIQRPEDSAVSAPLYTPQNTSARGGAVLDQRGPVSVKPRPSGFAGGLVGAAVGVALVPGGAGFLVGAFLGTRWLHAKRKNESVVYVKPEPGAPEAVRVKLWKLGSTAPLTDTGMRLVLEARNSDEMAQFLVRLWALFSGKLPREMKWRDISRIESYAKQMVASKGLDCTVTEILSELS